MRLSGQKVSGGANNLTTLPWTLLESGLRGLGLLSFSLGQLTDAWCLPGHIPGQELKESGDGGGVAVLISKLRRNPEWVDWFCSEELGTQLHNIFLLWVGHTLCSMPWCGHTNRVKEVALLWWVTPMVEKWLCQQCLPQFTITQCVN